MSEKFDSLEKFNKSLKEVEFLIDKVDKVDKIKLSQENRNESNIYLKSALILLTAKFEAFLENSILDYISAVNDFNLINTNIPETLKINHASNFLDETKLLEKIKHRPKYSEVCEDLKNLSELFGPSINFNQIKISNKFNYGAHGSNEIEKLFTKIGLDDIFEKILIYKYEITIDSNEKLPTKVDFKNIINRLTDIRNNILHQDNAISFTIKDLNEYCDYFQQFSNELIKLLNEQISRLDNIQMSTQI